MDRRTYGQTDRERDRQTTMTNLMVAFSQFCEKRLKFSTAVESFICILYLHFILIQLFLLCSVLSKEEFMNLLKLPDNRCRTDFPPPPPPHLVLANFPFLT